MKKTVVLGVVGFAVVAVAGGLTGCADSSAAGRTPSAVTAAGSQSSQPSVAGVGNAPSSSPAPSKSTPGAARNSPLDLSGAKLRFRQAGAVMTASQKSTQVASVTLTSATYTNNAVHAVFTVASERSVRMNTGNFKVFVNDGDAGFDNEKVITLPAGSHTVKVDATGIGSRPEGLGWDTVNGDGSAVWLREKPSEREKSSATQSSVLDLSNAKVRFTQSGAVMKAVQKSAVVASVTLTSATYTDNAVHAVFTVVSERSVRLNTGNFKVFVYDGDAGFGNEKVITLPAGSHTVKVDATGIGSRPEGLGWDTVNGDGGAVWDRS